jgi:GTP-binding protein HflX
VEVFNKRDLIDEVERQRIRGLYPGALCVSARTGEGRDELIAAMESRLALDTALVSVAFSSAAHDTRDRVAELYRLGRILRHVTTDGSIAIDVEIPRRLVPRFQDVRSQG